MKNQQDVSQARKHKMKVVFFVTFVYMFVEIVMGIIANSLALIADAGHMLSDIFSIGLTLLAINIGLKPHNSKFSFGYSRAEILAALFNGLSLILISAYIIVEAIQRIGNEGEILGSTMLIVASIGLGVNMWGMKYLHHQKNASLSLKSAYYHILADTLGSVAVIFAAIMIMITGMSVWDLVVSIIISFMIAIPGITILKNTTMILMQTTPQNIDLKCIEEDLMENFQINEIHDLHVWSLDGETTMLTAHLVVDEQFCQHDHQRIINSVQSMLVESHNIQHTTLQVENNSAKETAQCIKCD